MNYRTKTAFSLLEVMVAMGIFAVLAVLGISAYSSIQKSSRDSQRVSQLSQISDAINAFKLKNLRYPNTNEVTFSSGNANVGGTTIPLSSFKAPIANTSTNGTQYLYQKTTTGFRLCVELETLKVEGVGTDECPTSI